MNSHFEKIAEALASGAITNQEAEYLSALASASDPEVEKTASAYDGMVKEALGGSNNVAGTMIALGLAGSAMPLIYRAGRAFADPAIEEMRFRRMYGLPGGPPVRYDENEQAVAVAGGAPLSPDKAEQLYQSWFIPEVGPDGMAYTPQQRNDLVMRKAFNILHQVSPNVSAIPEVAHQAVSAQLGSGQGPARFMTGVVEQQSNVSSAIKTKMEMDRALANEVGNALTGASKSLGAFNEAGGLGGVEPLAFEDAKMKAHNAHIALMAEQAGKAKAMDELARQGNFFP